MVIRVTIHKYQSTHAQWTSRIKRAGLHPRAPQHVPTTRTSRTSTKCLDHEIVSQNIVKRTV